MNAVILLTAMLGTLGQSEQGDSVRVERDRIVAEQAQQAPPAADGDHGSYEAAVPQDVAALRAALAAGGAVRLPPGRYLVSQPLVVTRRVDLVLAPGAVLLADWTGGPAEAVVRLEPEADGSRLSGLTIDGQGHRVQGLRLRNVADVQIADLLITDTGSEGVWLAGCRRILIQDARLKRTQTYEGVGHAGALRVQDSSDVVVQRVQVWASGGKGVAFGRSRRCVAKDSTVHDTQRDPGDGFYFNNSHDCTVVRCHVLDPQGNGLKISRRSSRINVRDCRLFKERGVGFALFIQGGLDCQVTGNHLINRTSRATLRVHEHPLANVGGPALRNLITGNHLFSPEGDFFGQAGEVRDTVYRDNIEIRQDE